MKTNILIVLLILFSIGFKLSAQTLKNKNPYPSTFTSEIDQFLSLKAVTIAPAYDNVGGIYKKAAEIKLNDLISQDYFWSIIDFKLPLGDSKFQVDLLEDKPEYTKNILKSSNADALFSVITTKSSSGLNVTMNLYIKDGQLFLSSFYQDEKTFEINKYNEILEKLYLNIKQKLPYSGTIASRTGQNVTINLGIKSGLKKNDRLTVAQILAIKRHPKSKFMIGVEKEVIGQILITQVDSDLSFGKITFEKESGVVQKNSKLLPLNYVDYEQSSAVGQKPVLEYEKEAQEWVPAVAPQYGKMSAAIGISDFSLAAVNQSGLKAYQGSKNTSINIKLGAELWITSEWFASVLFHQTYSSVRNDLSGSSPEKISIVNSQYDFVGGYKYLINGHFWGPQLEIAAGILGDNTQLTDSNPTVFTSTSLSAYKIHIGGQFPLTEDNKFLIGGKFHLALFESLNEKPVHSGKGDSKLNKMDLFFIYAMDSNLQLKPELNYQVINTNFDGNGNSSNLLRSLEQKNVSYSLALEYLF